MKKIKILIFLLLLAIFETTGLDSIRIFNVRPDLILIAVIVLGFSYNLSVTLMFSFFAGFIKDILSTGPFGLNTFIFVLIVYTLSKLSKRFIIEGLILRIAIISIAVILENLVAGSILSFYASPISLGILLRLSFLSAIYTALFSYPIFKLINHI